MFAIVNAWQQGLLKKEYWVNNILSGVIVGVLALPLAMAFAIASGLKPEQGIYTAIIAGLIASIFGGSKVQITGPTGAFIIILSGITAQYGVSGLQVATLIAGIMLVCFSLMKLGNFIKFIPAPVIVGFTSGIGVLIWFTQWKEFFGLPEIKGELFHQKLIHISQVIGQLDVNTTLFALFSLAIIIVSPKIPYLKRIPAPLSALAICTLVNAGFQIEGINTIGTQFGGIPSGLPTFTLPAMNIETVIKLLGPAFTIALLGAIESLMSAAVADGLTQSKHDSNQELMGQGLANIIAPMFGGFAATGAIARTATNVRYGGNSPLAGIIHCVVLVLVLLFLAPLATHIPLCTLAAILFVVAYNMSDIPHFTHIFKHAPKADVIILCVTFLLTIFTDLVIAVNIGMIIAMLDFFSRMTSSVDIKAQSKDELNQEMFHAELPALPDNFLIYTIEGPFFFGAVEKLEATLEATHTEPETILIRLGHVPFMDITGLEVFENTIKRLQHRNVTVLLSEATPRVFNKLNQMGILEIIGPNDYHQNIESALDYYRENLARS